MNGRRAAALRLSPGRIPTPTDEPPTATPPNSKAVSAHPQLKPPGRHKANLPAIVARRLPPGWRWLDYGQSIRKRSLAVASRPASPGFRAIRMKDGFGGCAPAGAGLIAGNPTQDGFGGCTPSYLGLIPGNSYERRIWLLHPGRRRLDSGRISESGTWAFDGRNPALGRPLRRRAVLFYPAVLSDGVARRCGGVKRCGGPAAALSDA